MTPIGCAAVRPAVRWAAAEGLDLPGPVETHVGQCVRCQAEAARVRRTVRQAADLYPEAETPPAGLEGAVMAGTLEAQGSQGGWIKTATLLAAVAAFGVVLVLRRARVSSS